jgi:N-ethylmaleimide reductase
MKLFEQYTLGSISLSNRIVMAPLTRSRASADGVHSDIAVTYYTQRATAGLIIAEATAVSKQGSGYPHIPGIWNKDQTAAWSNITTAVHNAGGKIFLQLFHTGRIGHSSLLGEQPVCASSITPDGEVMAADFSMQRYETPRALSLEEIPSIVQQFKDAATHAKQAGFDGIEIHGANGYLIDQFLRDGSNQRTDTYGGSIENRARLLREIIQETVAVWGPGRVGVRLSPYNAFNSMTDSNPVATFTAVAAMLNAFPLAYLHLMEPLGEHPFGAPQGSVRIADQIRAIYTGTLMVNGGITKEIGEMLLQENKADLICMGVPFIANPDLVKRLQQDLPLTAPRYEYFYTGGVTGYIDYAEVA